MPFTIVSQGTFTQPATAINQVIPLPSGADYFVTTNLTQMATTQATGRVVRGEWYGGGLIAINDGLRWKKTNSTSAINIAIEDTPLQLYPSYLRDSITSILLIKILESKVIHISTLQPK